MLKIRYNGFQGVCFLHCFRHLLPFSTSSSTEAMTSDSFANYLVESLGFSKQQSLSTSARLSRLRQGLGVKKVSDFNFLGKANSVITFLKQNGLEQSHIRNVIRREPLILLSNVDKTLKPKIKVILDLGLPTSDLASVINVNPFVLRSSFSSAIKVLKQVLDSDEDIIRILKRPLLSSNQHAKHLIPNVALLESYGVPRERIQKLVVQQPNHYVIKTELLVKVLAKVEEKLGIPRHSGMFCYGIHLLLRATEKTIDDKCRVFKSFGWSDSDVRELIRRCPNCFCLSAERIKRSLQFLVSELGYEPTYVVTHPAILSYSLEKRTVPRYRVLQVLKEKGLIQKDYALYRALVLTEPKFLEKFVHPFQDAVPNLHEIYVTTDKGCCCSQHKE